MFSFHDFFQIRVFQELMGNTFLQELFVSQNFLKIHIQYSKFLKNKINICAMKWGENMRHTCTHSLTGTDLPRRCRDPSICGRIHSSSLLLHAQIRYCASKLCHRHLHRLAETRRMNLMFKLCVYKDRSTYNQMKIFKYLPFSMYILNAFVK